MAVSVSTNLTKVTISSAGVQGLKGDVGDNGVTQDVSGLASTASLNQFTSSYLTDSASFANRLNNATNEQDLSTYISASVFNNKTGSFVTTSSFNSFTSSYLTDSASFATRLNNATNEQDLSTYLSASVFNNKTGSFATTASINTITSSFDSVFLGISSVTGSLIGITNTLMAFTAALDNTYATDAQLYQLYQATASIYFTTQSLNTQTGSQDLVNTAVSYVTGSINTTTSSFNNEFVKIGLTTASIHFATQSLNTQTGSQDSVNLTISNVTSSFTAEIGGIEAYTASLKAVAIISSSTQVLNYNLFALTASANTFYGNQTIQGNLHLSNTSPLLYNASNTNAMLFGFFDGSSIYGPYYQIFGSNYSNVSQRGSAEFVFDSRNSGFSGFNVAEFNGSTWLRKFRVSQHGVEVTGSLVVDGGITGSILATNSVVSSSQQVLNYHLFALTASANTFYGTQSVTGSVRISGSIDDISYIDFDTVAPATGIARLGWDDGEGTLTIGLSGGNVNIPIGVASFENAYNADSSSISKGEVVRISGAQGNRVAIKKAHNHNDDGSATTIALAAETIGVGVEGKVLTTGPLKGIDTTAFGEGDLLYLSSTPGGITNIKPQAPFHEVRIGVAQRIHASVGIINIKVDNGYEIDELHNVLIHTASLANKQLLAYSGSVWANQTISELGIAITGSNVFSGSQTITGSLLVTGSAKLNNDNIVSSNTVLKIETISSASYAALNPPVSGTLYIII